MSSAAEIRKQVETALGGRIPSALWVRSVVLPELISCGVTEVDAALGGGLPLGGIAEISGEGSSGRTTLTLATLAGITQQGDTCAYIDVTDSFDPFSASALGVNPRRLLWVRAGEADAAVVSSPFMAAAPRTSAVDNKPASGGWNHPRAEALGMDRAVGELFRGKHSAEHTREPLDFTPRCSEPIRRKRIEPVIVMPEPEPSRTLSARTEHTRFSRKPWSRLDKALRATDLLLNAGGFRAIVLDMGDVAPEQARRVPLATWYRFRLQTEKTRTLFLVLTRLACANSCAAVSLHCEVAKANWQQADQASPQLLAGLSYRISVARNRAVDPYRKKSASSAPTVWRSATSWSR